MISKHQYVVLIFLFFFTLKGIELLIMAANFDRSNNTTENSYEIKLVELAQLKNKLFICQPANTK